MNLYNATTRPKQAKAPTNNPPFTPPKPTAPLAGLVAAALADAPVPDAVLDAPCVPLILKLAAPVLLADAVPLATDDAELDAAELDDEPVPETPANVYPLFCHASPLGTCHPFPKAPVTK